VTPVTRAAQNALRRLWVDNGIEPELGTIDHWSLEYAREVYGIVGTAKECGVPLEIIVELLIGMGVWDPDLSEQQWEPS
jgi:hypothetical protein